MKYHTFRIIAGLTILLFVLGGSCLCVKSCSSPTPTTAVTTTYAPAAPTYVAPAAPTYAPPPTQAPVTRVAPPPTYPTYAPPATPAAHTNAEIKSILSEFLAHHGKNNGRDKWQDCIPNAPFKATAVKFAPGPHAQYSSQDQTLWSQIKLDLNRDGVDDAKILLKDNVPYKLERINASGKTVGSPEFL